MRPAVTWPCCMCVAGMKSVWGAGVMSMISRFWATYAMNTGFQFTVEVRKYTVGIDNVTRFFLEPESVFVDLSTIPEIDSQPGGFLDSINVYKYGLSFKLRP
jgi:hypothetical protein